MSFCICKICKRLFSCYDGFDFPPEFWHKCEGKIVQAYGIVGYEDSEINSAIEKEYGEDPQKKEFAEKLAVFAGEFSHSNPVGSREERKAKRIKKRDYRRQCRRHLEEKSKDIPRPVGFIGGFIFMAFLSGLISWLVQMMLRKYFEDEEE